MAVVFFASIYGAKNSNSKMASVLLMVTDILGKLAASVSVSFA